jgi:integrase/recombinase XerD
MRLLTRGVGIKAIGDVLGHRSLESTCAYLRLDHAMLRDVALAVPGAHAVSGGRHV